MMVLTTASCLSRLKPCRGVKYVRARTCVHRQMEFRLEKSHFTPIGDAYVEKVANIFKHMSFSPEDEVPSHKWIKISGDAFGEEWKGMEFWIHPYNKGSFSVQMCKKEKSTCYMFGIHFSTEGNVTHAQAYHHGHGPFPKLYGCEYEVV